MTQNNEYVLVNPTTQAVVAAFDGAPRLPTMAGIRVGIIDDCKPNADVLLEELVEVLRTRYEISGARWHRKLSSSRPAVAEAIKDLAENCDAVIIGVGD